MAESVQEYINKIKTNIESNNDINTFDGISKAVNLAAKECSNMSNKLSSCKDEIDYWNRSITSSENKIKALQEEIKQLEYRFNKGENLAYEIDSRKQRIDNINENIVSYKSTVKKLENNKTVILNKINAIDNLWKEYKTKQTTLQSTINTQPQINTEAPINTQPPTNNTENTENTTNNNHKYGSLEFHHTKDENDNYKDYCTYTLSNGTVVQGSNINELRNNVKRELLKSCDGIEVEEAMNEFDDQANGGNSSNKQNKNIEEETKPVTSNNPEGKTDGVESEKDDEQSNNNQNNQEQEEKPDLSKGSKNYMLVCRKVGVLAGTRFANLFVEYLAKQTFDWGTLTEGELIIEKADKLKEHKKNWINERKANKEANDEEKAKAKLEQQNQKKEAKEKAKEAKKAHDNAQTAYKNAEKDLSNANKALKTAQKTSIHSEINKAVNAVERAKEALNKAKEEFDKTASEAEKAALNEKLEEKEAEQKLKEIQFYFKSFKKYVKEFQEGDKSINTDDYILIASYMYNHKDTFKYEILKSEDVTDKHSSLYSFCEITYGAKNKITSIENELSEDDKALAKELTPNASGAFLSGAMSNTFQLAAMGQNLASGEFLQQQQQLIMSTSMMALEKLTGRVQNQLVQSIKDIMDVTMLAKIPLDAAQEMMKQIMTPGDAIKALSELPDTDALQNEAKDIMNKAIGKVKEKADNAMKEVNFLVGNKLEKFNKGIKKIQDTMNQPALWYIDNINKYEKEAESTILKAIEDATTPILEAKFQFADQATEVLAYNLVQPVNKAIMDVQAEILRKVKQVKEFAIAQAKALTAKALMKLMGLLGL